MKNWMIVTLAGLGIFILGLVMTIGSVISTANQEVDLRTAIVAKQKDNTSQFDAMWKTISQTAQVTDAQKKALIEIFTGYAQARSGNDKGGSLANWIHEAVPNVDTSTFNNLQNIITAERDGFAMRQKELLDLSREHNRLLQRFPSNIVLSMLGRKEIDIQIVTSTRTDNAFQSGKDDDVNVFQKQ
jgi:hypothetical protein